MWMLPIEGCWDSHAHVFGDATRYPLTARRGYTPAVRTIETLVASLHAHGIGHAVLVHPSVYGRDLGCLLDSLERTAGRHRGIIPVTPAISDAQLAAFHRIGIRGARFNLVSPGGDTLDDFDEVAARIGSLGWHAQIFVTPDHLELTERLIARTRTPIVLDHFAGFASTTDERDDRWRRLLRMMGSGRCWVKLSGFYRLSSEGYPYRDLDRLAGALARVAPERLLWGSDWPHTYFWEHSAAVPPTYADTLAVIERVFGDTNVGRSILSDNPQSLYR